MASTTDMSPSKTPSRRVLGDLSTNARNSPSIARFMADGKSTTTPYGSPLKIQQSFTPAALLSYKDHFDYSPMLSSKKRPFDAVDGANDENQDARYVRRSPLRQGKTLSPTLLEAPNAQTPHVDTVPEIHTDTEEDAEGALPLPQPATGATEETVPVSTGGSFSSLIDYDPAEASDKSQAASVSPVSSRGTRQEDAQTGPAQRPPTRAETLRLRLKMAMYRVNTDQVHIPISDLRLPRSTLARSLSAASNGILRPKPRPTTTSTDIVQSTTKPTIAHLVEKDIPKLLPGPQLQPSSLAPTSHKIAYALEPASPVANSPDKGRLYATPTGTRRIHGIFTVSTAENSPLKDGDNLTSSVVKGRAATGLLELRRGA